jgi:hypothetical protein
VGVAEEIILVQKEQEIPEVLVGEEEETNQVLHQLVLLVKEIMVVMREDQLVPLLVVGVALVLLETLVLLPIVVVPDHHQHLLVAMVFLIVYREHQHFMLVEAAAHLKVQQHRMHQVEQVEVGEDLLVEAVQRNLEPTTLAAVEVVVNPLLQELPEMVVQV